MTGEAVLFWIAAPLALGTALAVVLLRNPIHAALMLVVNFFAIAALYAALEAQFLAVVQLIVYAGAIMVLFLFVLMLLGVDRELPLGERLRGQRPTAVLLGAALLVLLLVSVAGPYLGEASACGNAQLDVIDQEACVGLRAVHTQAGGNIAALGGLLFTRYLWPFEVTSVLLVIGALAAMVLARRVEHPADATDAPEASGTEFAPPPPEASGTEFAPPPPEASGAEFAPPPEAPGVSDHAMPADPDVGHGDQQEASR